MNLNEIVAAESSFTVNGKTYQTSPLTAREHAKVQTRILSMRGDPIEVARKLADVLNPEERKELFEKAYNDAVRAKIVTAGEVDAFMNTLEGTVYCIYLSLQKYHPEIDEDEAASLVEQQGREFLDGIITELQAKVGDATPEQIARLVADKEAAWLSELICKIAGLPEGNSASPAQGETELTGHSLGNDGSKS